MSTVTGTTADLRRRWARVARHLQSASDELSGAGDPNAGLAAWLNDESLDYRTLIAVHVMSSVGLLLTLARTEAATIEGADYKLKTLPCGCQDVIYADGTIDREHDHVECDGAPEGTA